MSGLTKALRMFALNYFAVVMGIWRQTQRWVSRVFNLDFRKKYDTIGFYVGILSFAFSVVVYVLDATPTDEDVERYLAGKFEDNPAFFHLSLNKYAGSASSLELVMAKVLSQRPFQSLPEEPELNAGLVQYILWKEQPGQEFSYSKESFDSEIISYFNCIERVKDILILVDERLSFSPFEYALVSPYVFPYCQASDFPENFKVDFLTVEYFGKKALKRLIAIEDVYIQPSSWRTLFGKYFVEYSDVEHRAEPDFDYQALLPFYCELVFTLAYTDTINPRYGIEYSRARTLARTKCNVAKGS